MKPWPILVFLSSAAWCQDLDSALTAEQFDAYVTGKTLFWSFEGQAWGAEEYLPGRLVQWASQPGECQIGRWYEEAGQICFRYDGGGAPSCWIFRATITGLTADLQGPKGPFLLQEAGQTDDGLDCPGPEVGV